MVLLHKVIRIALLEYSKTHWGPYIFEIKRDEVQIVNWNREILHTPMDYVVWKTHQNLSNNITIIVKESLKLTMI